MNCLFFVFALIASLAFCFSAVVPSVDPVVKETTLTCACDYLNET